MAGGEREGRGRHVPAAVATLAITVLSVLLMLLSAFPMTAEPARNPAPPAALPEETSPDLSSSTSYTVTVSATQNTTASNAEVDSGAAWTLTDGNHIATSPSFTLPSTYFSWNGTYSFLTGSQLEFRMGAAFPSSGECDPSLGTVWVNMTVGSTTYTSTTVFNTYQSGYCTIPEAYRYAYLGVQILAPGPLAGIVRLQVACSADPNEPVDEEGGFQGYGPALLFTVPVTGTGKTSALNTAIGTAGSVPLDWGWRWANAAAVTSSFSPPAATLSSPELSWSSSYEVNATYNSVTQHETTSGTFSVASPTTVKFQGGRSDPADVYSFSATYTISGTVVAQFLLTYNFTQPWDGGTLKSTTTYGATEVSPWNATWSEYTYTVPTPYSNVSAVWAAGSPGWEFVSAWPSGYVYTAANLTAAWEGTVPSDVQIVFLAPVQYGSAVLSIIYVPESPIFSLFGAALAYSSVETYVDGNYAPYSNVPASLGQTLSVRTFDIFGHLLYSGDVNVTQSDQVDTITLDIWPMSIVNLNSSYVVALNLQNYGVTQIAPDLMPLQSYVFYLPEGNYNFTIQYLAFEGGAVGSPITFSLNISGVSYDVVNGLTFLSVIANEQSIGNNLTKVITGVNLTVLSTSADLENLIASLSEGLLAYHFVTGTASVTGDSYSLPVTVTTGTGTAANLTVTQAMAQTLTLTFLNATGTFDIPCYASGAAPGTFTLAFTLSTSEQAQLTGGTAAVLLTGTYTAGTSSAVGTGVVASAVLLNAVRVGPPPNPLSQSLSLYAGNETAVSGGFFSDSTKWTNGLNATFSGVIYLTGPFAGGSSVSVTVNGTTLLASQWGATASGLVIYSSVVSVAPGSSLTVTVTYERTSGLSFFTTVFFSYEGLQVAGPQLVLILSAMLLAGAAVEDFRSRSKRLDTTVAFLLALVVFGGMILV